MALERVGDLAKSKRDLGNLALAWMAGYAVGMRDGQEVQKLDGR